MEIKTYRWKVCVLCTQAAIASFTTCEKRSSISHVDVWGLILPNVWIFGRILWYLCQTKSTACFIHLCFCASKDRLEFQNHNQELCLISFPYSGKISQHFALPDVLSPLSSKCVAQGRISGFLEACLSQVTSCFK